MSGAMISQYRQLSEMLVQCVCYSNPWHTADDVSIHLWSLKCCTSANDSSMITCFNWSMAFNLVKATFSCCRCEKMLCRVTAHCPAAASTCWYTCCPLACYTFIHIMLTSHHFATLGNLHVPQITVHFADASTILKRTTVTHTYA